MERLRIVFLLFVSLWLWHASAITLDGKRQYSVTIEMPRGSLSGICLIKTDASGSKGSLVNEFGIHALDFTVSTDRRKVRLLHVIDRMNKWYIKRILRRDLRFLFLNKESAQDRRREVIVAGDTTILHNKKYRITYTFTEIKNEIDQ